MTTPSVPQHIAIIMDGNRRWAKARHLPVLEGHRRVTDDVLEPLIEHASQIGIKYLTFWAWSTENWEREKHEVLGIMNLFRHVVKNRWQRLHEKGVKIQTIGNISQFPKDLHTSLVDIVEQTKYNTAITVVFALNYGGRDEITRSIRRLILQSQREIQKKADAFQITPEDIATHLDTALIPDPDMIIRTGGEKRLSGFLLWQSQYSELFFVDYPMPEFTPQKLDEAVREFHHRQRRFGK